MTTQLMIKETLLKLAEQFSTEANVYHEMANNGVPLSLRPEWEGTARGLDRAATVLTAEAWTTKEA